MYDELVKRLRELQSITEHCGEQLCFECENRELCDKHDNKTLSGTYKEAADVIEGLSHAVDQMTEWRKNPWIPVTERLPQEWWPVLGLIQYHDEKEPPAQQVLWYLGNGHWRETWRGDMIESDVTHWMPLPEPPKEEP